MRIKSFISGVLIFVGNFKVVIAIFLILAGVSACNQKSKKSDSYYYSEAGLDESATDTIVKVDISNKVDVVHFLKNKSFRSKTNRMVFNDSLVLRMYHNGKEGIQAKCEIQNFIVDGERPFLVNDSINNQQLRFTINPYGAIADKNSYAVYKPEK